MNSGLYRGWLLKELKAHGWEFAGALICTAVSAGFYLLMTVWTPNLLDRLQSKNVAGLTGYLVLGLAIFLAGQVFNNGRVYLMMRLTNRMMSRTRQLLFHHILEVSPRLLSSVGDGNLLSTFSNDLQAFQNALTSVVGTLIPSAILVLVYAGAMIWYSPLLFGLALVMMSPIVWVTSLFGGKMYVAVHKAQDGLARLIARFEEMIGGVKEIKSFGRENEVIERFDDLSEETLAINLRREQIDSLHPMAVALALAAGICAMILLSVVVVNYGLVTLKTLIAFLVCVAMLYPPLQETSHAIGRQMAFRAIMERFRTILGLPVEADGNISLRKGATKGALTFENVGFAYQDGSFRVENFSLEIAAGTTLAIVGSSGAGKSTLLDFIPRFLNPQTGRLLLDGEDVCALRLADLRCEIGYVSQEPVLFEATLEENLRFGAPDACDEDVLLAAQNAHVDEFAQRLPGGYGMMVESRGRNLSVGQRQRIALARVFLRNPRILLFDEPTSALDAISERLVRDAMKRASAGRTTLIVAHRMSTVRRADRIIVLDGGRIMEDGTHEQLMERRGSYFALTQAQSGSGEGQWDLQPA